MIARQRFSHNLKNFESSRTSSGTGKFSIKFDKKSFQSRQLDKIKFPSEPEKVVSLNFKFLPV